MYGREDGTPPQVLKGLKPFLEQRRMCGDVRAQEMLPYCAEAVSLDGVFLKLDSQSHNLRSLLLHKKTITEETSVLFTVSRLTDGRYLAFDCEALGYPVITTARAVATDIPFLVMNTVAVYLGIDLRITRSDCAPEWGKAFVVLSDSVDETGKGPIVHLGARMIPDGGRIRTERLKPEVLARAFVIEEDTNAGKGGLIEG